MLFVHEVHRVVGSRETEFETLYREGWMPALAKGSDSRLLYYLHHAHGTGPAYQVITVTAVRNGAAWDELGRQVQVGELREWAADVDALRHSVTSKVLRPTEWSPLQTIDLGAVPTDGTGHEQSLFMEDTAWPHVGKLDDYLALAGTKYLEILRRAEEAGRSLLRLEAGFQPAFGAGRHREVVLWQRVIRPEGLLPLFAHEVPEEHKAPGTWMNDALEVRDQWESRLLRNAAWSPLP